MKVAATKPGSTIKLEVQRDGRKSEYDRDAR